MGDGAYLKPKGVNRGSGIRKRPEPRAEVVPLCRRDHSTIKWLWMERTRVGLDDKGARNARGPSLIIQTGPSGAYRVRGQSDGEAHLDGRLLFSGIRDVPALRPEDNR